MPKLKTEYEEEEVKEGESIVLACEKLGIPFFCYTGICGSCRIQITAGAGNLSEITSEERAMGMDQHTRLACQCKIRDGDVKIRF